MRVGQQSDTGVRRRACSKSAGRAGIRHHEESRFSRYSSVGVSLRATRMGPPQRGQCHSGAGSVEGIGAGWRRGWWPLRASRVRAKGSI